MIRGSYKNCFVPQCTNTTVKTPEKLFITVPKSEPARTKWFKACRREDQGSLKTAYYCCEDHFNIEKDVANLLFVRTFISSQKTPVRLVPGVIPSKFECQSSRLVTGTKSSRRSSVCEKLERLKVVKDLIESSNPPPSIGKDPKQELRESTSHEDSHPLEGNLSLAVGKNVAEKEDEEVLRESEFLLELLPQTCEKGVQVRPDALNKAVQARSHIRSKSFQIQPMSTSATTSPMKMEVRSESQPQSKRPRLINELTLTTGDYDGNDDDGDRQETIVSTSSSSFSVSSQSTSSMSATELQEKTRIFKARCFAVTTALMEIHPKLYLGLPSKCFFVIQTLANATKLPDRDIMIVLKKIRTNHQFAVLAHDFGLTEGRISKIFHQTMPLIAAEFKKLIFWPSDDVVYLRLPISFRKNYSSVVSIIDCFEIQIERPSNAVTQAMTWSEYYGCNTFKFLISCTPNGFINFISEGYGGRASDKQILTDSSYLDNIRPGNQILADRGFKEISSILEKIGASLVRPPSVAAGSKLSQKEVSDSRRIASLRIHVERVINRIREFKILAPHSTVDNKLLHCLDVIVVCACGIINLQNPIN